jgi:citrate synthase
MYTRGLAVATYLSASEAAAELGVSLPTLYAYVSRGLLRSHAEGRSRRRKYAAEDVWLLKQRKEQRRHPEAAEDALRWGLPLLESRLSVIHDGRLFYCGTDAVELAGTVSLESVAALLWSGEASAAFPEDHLQPAGWDQIAAVAKRLPPLEGLQLHLPLAAAADSHAYDLRPDSVRRAGARILRLLSAAAVGVPVSSRPVAQVLQQGWARRDSALAGLLDAALVLYADNGLNPSSFTARCVASAGATPYAVVSAGLAALQGSKHGGAAERAAGLLNEVGEARAAHRAVLGRLRRGETIPGFGHPQYPAGDPRAAYLLERIAGERPKAQGVRVALALVDAVHELMNERPTIDFAVVTLCRALALPPAAPLQLLGVARVVGWIAHALEQYTEGREIRPRARYAGRLPAG